MPFAESKPVAAYIFAFRALPMVLVVSALATLLFYWGMLQRIVQAFAWVLRRSVGVGGPLGLGAAVHIFVGHIEAPLLIRPYLAKLERGELFALMSCGMAGIAGTVMVLYASLIGPVIPGALGHILTAAVISTPAALAIAALMVPFRPDPSSGSHLALDDPPVSSMDAVAKGTRDGIVFLLNIIAMLIVMLALVSLANSILGVLPEIAGEKISLQRLFAYAFRPVMWLIGVPGPDTATAASLMATKTVLNEFIAYVDLSKLPPEALSAACAADPDLCDVRFREFRQSRNPDRRHGRDGAGAPPRDRRARPALDPVGHARHLHERRDRRDAAVSWHRR